MGADDENFVFISNILNMEVKIHIESECPVPYQTSDLKINLNNVECIGDLKKKLQPLLSVAACDMSVPQARPQDKSEIRKQRENIEFVCARRRHVYC
jgi:hypothetical protein